jgi:hypothetical protein
MGARYHLVPDTLEEEERRDKYGHRYGVRRTLQTHVVIVGRYA